MAHLLGKKAVFAEGLAGGGRWAFGHWQGRAVGWRFTNDVVLVDGVAYAPRPGEIILMAEEGDLQPSLIDPEMLDRAGHLFQNCDRIILACTPDRRAAWAEMLKCTEKNVEVLAPELDAVGAMALRRLGDRATLLVSCGPLGLRQSLTKRAFDLAISLPLLLLFAPVMALVALAIKLDSRGPIFFAQPRVGQDNRIFKMLKFRSMRISHGDEAGTLSTRREDERVTRVGKWIRLTSLDELPQLINVVMGEMSIVGPRPHALGSTAEDELFWTIDRRYWERHAVKPGITGLAQVRGYRGATQIKADLENRLQADLEYVNGWTLTRDFMILLRTVRVLIHSRAY